MHNPAWRPAQLHSGRLAGIRHHYIDERPAVRSSGGQRAVHTLAVHLAVAPGHPVAALQPQYLVDALTRQLNIQSCSADRRPDWRLEVIRPEGVPPAGGDGLVLVFATANLEGVRRAYTGIKRLAAVPGRRYAVLFAGAPDADIARRCQERLASGAGEFLGIRLHALGHLAAPGPDFSAGLARLAGEVQRLRENQSANNQPEVIHS
jgi:hypothetical protein